MRLRLAKIGSEMQPVEQVLEEGWLREILAGPGSTEFAVQGGQSVTIQAQRLGLDVLLNASFTLRLKSDCSSCLQGFDLEVPVRFSITLKPRTPQADKVSEDLELTREDLEEYTYGSEDIDLGEILREQIILALPMYPRCSETCRGLCPVCGVNLNLKVCDCERGDVDPRWTKLKALTKQ